MEKESVLKLKTVRMPKRGELVISKKLIVLVTGYGNYNIGYRCFSGVVVSSDEEFETGLYSRTWDCAAFKKLDCKINFLPLLSQLNKTL